MRKGNFRLANVEPDVEFSRTTLQEFLEFSLSTGLNSSKPHTLSMALPFF